ncbi:unnamed protein product [Cyprideis torosa]|uniref:Uncharacterized protein n=1 Tax=Cyprideis torosa TaxID=163714 RepID=A0A7R8ZLP3_9CRUS|nr:unnamed protein product [Cyprideis torosa]CAG0882662.1 unnamed protein product [Cyprideis torosa]
MTSNLSVRLTQSSANNRANVAGHDNFCRLNFLFQSAEFLARFFLDSNPECKKISESEQRLIEPSLCLAQDIGEESVRLGQKTQLRLDPSIKRRICKVLARKSQYVTIWKGEFLPGPSKGRRYTTVPINQRMKFI